MPERWFTVSRLGRPWYRAISGIAQRLTDGGRSRLVRGTYNPLRWALSHLHLVSHTPDFGVTPQARVS